VADWFYIHYPPPSETWWTTRGSKRKLNTDDYFITAIRYVLELNAGLAAELGIEPGAELRSPALDQSAAAWRC